MYRRERLMRCGLLAILTLSASCWLSHEDCGTVTVPCRNPDAQKLDDFVRNSHAIVLPPDADAPTGPTVETESNGQTISSTPYRATLSVDEIAGFNPNSGILWPGALVQGQSLATGVLAAVAVNRAPLTITIGNLGTTSAPPQTSKTIEHPSAATVEDARNALINVPGLILPAKFSYTSKEFTSLEHGLLQLGVSASWLSASVKGQLSSESYASKHNLLVRFTQEYYTVAAVPPASPIAYFASDVTRDDLRPYADSITNPITYVSSVTYGRMALLTISSSESIDKLRATVDAAVSWATGSASASLTSEQQRVLQESETKLLILGGDASSAVQAITGDKLANLQKYIQDGARLSATSPGFPISYRVSYLHDNTAARVAFSTDYQRVTSTPIPALTGFGITFHTNDDNKDHDTNVTVSVTSTGGAQYATWALNADQEFRDNSDNGFGMSQVAPLYIRDIGTARITICIQPNGNDTWKFNYVLGATRNTGGGYTSGASGQTLTQSNRCLTHGLAAAP